MPDLAPVTERLRDLWRGRAAGLAITKDGPDGFTVEIPGYEGEPLGYVGGVRQGKRYVSLYYMGVYAEPALVEAMTPALRARMQGKACFNFTTLDEGLISQLDRLIAGTIDAHVASIPAIAAARSGR